MAFANNMDRDQAPPNVGPDLQSILFDTQHQNLLKTGCISLDYMHSEDKAILSSLQIVQKLLEGTVL